LGSELLELMKNLDAYADSCVKFKDKIRAILADIGLVRSDDYDIIIELYSPLSLKRNEIAENILPNLLPN